MPHISDHVQFYTPREVVDYMLGDLKTFLDSPPRNLPADVRTALIAMGQDVNEEMKTVGMCGAGDRECYDVWTGA